MEILLLGRETSITNTIENMLTSVEEWTVTSSFSIENTAASHSKDSLYNLIIANLADFAPPPMEIISKIIDRFPSAYLLVLYSYREKMLIQPLLEAGAHGYLQHGLPEDQLFEAVKKVAAGNQYIGVETT